MQRRVCVYVCCVCYVRMYVCYVSMYVMYVCMYVCMCVYVYVCMLCYVMSPALALRLGSLYFFLTRTYMCLDTCQKVWFYLHRGSSRKFAEGSRKGEAEDFFWNNEYGVNFMYICMLCYVMVFTLRYAMLCLVMLCYYVCSVMYVLYCNVM